MKKNNLKIKIATGVALLVVGTLVLLSDTIKEKRDVVFSLVNLELSVSTEEIFKDEPTEEEIEKPVEVIKEEPKKEKENNYVYEKYLGVLSIPKINLNKGYMLKMLLNTKKVS